jgi:hypothetical protein
MVDYNIAIPQQQLFQAPDVMQNAMRMQQMEQMGATSRLRNMQAQNLLAAQQQTAAERAQAAAIEEEASGAVRGGASPTEAAQNLTREGKLGAAARISALGETLSKGQQAELDTVDNTLKGFGYWSTHVRSPEEAGSLGAGMYNTSRLRPFFESIGIKSPEQAAQKFSTDFATDENAWRTGLAKLDAPTLFSLRAVKQVELPNGGKGTIDPNRPGVINESVIREAGAQDTYLDRNLAARQDTQRRLNLPVTVNDGGLVARADTGAPVNALAAGQRQQPAVVGNAMAAPIAAASPYGALVQPRAARAPGVVGSGAFAQRVKLQEAADKIAAAENEAYARTQGTSRATAEATAKEKLPELANTIKELEDAMKPGGLIEQSTATPAGRARDAAGRLINVSTTGSEAIAKLQPLRARLLMSMPRLEGPQGVLDLELYNQASGDMANPEKSTGDRMAAAETVLRIIKANRSQFEARLPEGQRVPAGVKRPSNKNEYDALPAGSVYIDPNGDERTKR